MNIGGLVGALLPVFFVLALGYIAGEPGTIHKRQLCNLGLFDKQKHRLVAFPENTLRRSRVAAEVVSSPRESRE
jgi:hypothetical protein